MRFTFLLLVSLLVLLTQASASALPQAKDPMVKKALGRIAEVEAAEGNLAAGDAKAAATLKNKLGWATKRLNAVVQQGTAEFKSAKKRHDAVLAKINAKAKAPAPKPKGNPPGKTPAGRKPPVKTPAGKTPPKPATPAFDYDKLVALNKSVNQEFENTKLLQFKHFMDTNRVNGMRKSIAKFREKISVYPAGDPNVKVVTSNIDNLENLVNMGTDRIVQDTKTAPAINARLDKLFDKYSDENAPSRIEKPYSENQVRAWARELQYRLTVALPADMEWLKSVSSNVVVGSNRFGSVDSNLRISVQSGLELSRKHVVERMDGEAANGIEAAEWILETDPKDRNQVLQRVLGKGAFDENMVRLRDAALAIEMAKVIDEELARAEHPDREAQAKIVQNAIVHLKSLVRSTLSEVRMPKAASTDEKLLKIAAETLAKKKYEIAGWKGLVINSDIREEVRREAWLDPGTVRSTITFYDYKWKQFQVTTAEKVGDEYWLFSNTLKYYESGDRTTPVGEWILSRRMELTPILEENIGKAKAK